MSDEPFNRRTIRPRSIARRILLSVWFVVSIVLALPFAELSLGIGTKVAEMFGATIEPAELKLGASIAVLSGSAVFLIIVGFIVFLLVTKLIPETVVLSRAEHVIHGRSGGAGTWRRVGYWFRGLLARRWTIMLIPHSEKRVVNLQISGIVLIVVIGGLLLAVVLAPSVLVRAAERDANIELIQTQLAIERTQERLEELNEERKELEAIVNSNAEDVGRIFGYQIRALRNLLIGDRLIAFLIGVGATIVGHWITVGLSRTRQRRKNTEDSDTFTTPGSGQR